MCCPWRIVSPGWAGDIPLPASSSCRLREVDSGASSLNPRNGVQILRAVIFGLVTMCLAGACLANSSYEEAYAQAKADTLNPQYRQWFTQIMQPAFNPVFQSLLNKCVIRPPETMQGFGIVFAVSLEGTVTQISWKSPNSFTACLEPRIRTALFPPAPKKDFFFALEVLPAPSRSEP